jgi:hypothetical protein
MMKFSAISIGAFLSAAVQGAQGKHSNSGLPSQAQFIDQKDFNVLENVLPATRFNATTVSRPADGATSCPAGFCHPHASKRRFR